MSSVVDVRRQDLKLVKKIGEGGFGTVFHMIWKRESGDIHVAAKRLYKVEQCELDVLSSLDHDNIVKLLGVVPEELDFMLILELCQGGSLRSYLNRHNRKPLPEELLETWSKQAAKAIEYLQEKNIVHKDIKSENYVISQDNTLKLTDFGLSKKLERTFSNASQSGTRAYMAPELLKDCKLSPTKFDIFAYGVVVWEMLTGQVPYEGMEYQAIVWHVCHDNKRLKIPVDCPPHLAELLNLCWQDDHKKRPSIQEVLVLLDAGKNPYADGWELVNHFAYKDDPDATKVYQACGIAIHGNGDIAVSDNYTCQTKVYNNTGQFKVSLGDKDTRNAAKVLHNDPQSVVISSDGNYFVTDGSHLVKIYDEQGKFKQAFPVFSTRNRECSENTVLAGLAFDNNGNMLVGASLEVTSFNFISKHMPSGKHICSFSTALLPQFLAVTPLNTIIISDPWDNDIVEVIDQTGKHLSMLSPPMGVTRWRPTGLCCSADTIFVANDNSRAPDEYGVYCYSLSGDYLGCAIKEVTNPTGIALTEDGNKLVVAQYESGNPMEGHGMHGVKVFQKKKNKSK